MDQLNARLNNALRGTTSDHPSPLFRAVVPVRVLRDSELRNPVIPAVPMGVAIDPRSHTLLKMGGVCDCWFGRHYGLQIFFFP
jgi:hypothetical protein